jgi:hypothetical protein
MTESIALYSNFTPESGDDLWPFSSPSHLASFGGRRFVGSHFVIRPYRSYDEIYEDHFKWDSGLSPTLWRPYIGQLLHMRKSIREMITWARCRLALNQ